MIERIGPYEVVSELRRAPGTLIDYAWESTPNVGILAGVAVPEPASLGVLGIGGATLVQRRRRRSV